MSISATMFVKLFYQNNINKLFYQNNINETISNIVLFPSVCLNKRFFAVFVAS